MTTFDLLTLKVVSESRVTWAISILVFLGLSVLDLGPMYATDRQTDVRQKHRLMPLPITGWDIINKSAWLWLAGQLALMWYVTTLVEWPSNGRPIEVEQ